MKRINEEDNPDFMGRRRRLRAGFLDDFTETLSRMGLSGEYRDKADRS